MPKRLIPNEIESAVALRHEASTARNARIQVPHLVTPGKGAFKQSPVLLGDSYPIRTPQRITHVLDFVPDRLVCDRTNALHNGGTLIGKPMCEALGAKE